MMMNNTVYGVFTMGTDYYDNDYLLYSLYHDKDVAEAKASELRALTQEEYGCPDEHEYSSVKVEMLTIR